MQKYPYFAHVVLFIVKFSHKISPTFPCHTFLEQSIIPNATSFFRGESGLCAQYLPTLDKVELRPRSPAKPNEVSGLVGQQGTKTLDLYICCSVPQQLSLAVLIIC